MLTNFQRARIDNLPVEGEPQYTTVHGSVLGYADAAVRKWASLPLVDKVAPHPSEKRAIILHGAPGSGKSYLGMQRLVTECRAEVENFGYISYDEAGAIYDIPEYVERLLKLSSGENFHQHNPTETRTLAERQQLWLDFQPLSQRIRSLTLKEALHRELSVLIDTTSSSTGTFRLIETLRDLDYQHIEIWSTASNLTMAEDRIAARLRPTSSADLLGKRVGAFQTLPDLCTEADRLVLTLNDSDRDEPEDIAVFEHGQLRAVNAEQLRALCARQIAEQTLFNQRAGSLLPDQKDLPEQHQQAVMEFDRRMGLYLRPTRLVTPSVQP